MLAQGVVAGEDLITPSAGWFFLLDVQFGVFWHDAVAQLCFSVSYYQLEDTCRLASSRRAQLFFLASAILLVHNMRRRVT